MANNLGAMWNKVSRKGDSYLSGYIEIDGKRTQFCAFPNKYKKDNNPDYTILPTIIYEKPKEQAQDTSWLDKKQKEMEGDGINNERELPF